MKLESKSDFCIYFFPLSATSRSGGGTVRGVFLSLPHVYTSKKSFYKAGSLGLLFMAAYEEYKPHSQRALKLWEINATDINISRGCHVLALVLFIMLWSASLLPHAKLLQTMRNMGDNKKQDLQALTEENQGQKIVLMWNSVVL